MNLRLNSALLASGAHFLLSIFVALCMAGLVFYLWYPWPFDEVVRGRELFWLVIGVDVVCGPLLTLILWNPAKLRKELALDLGLIVSIQLAALVYGLHTVALARPVHLVFEVDRFRLVTAVEIASGDLPQAPSHLRSLPWTGPTLLGTRASRNSDETLHSIELSIAGQEPSVRPGWWQDYELSKKEILNRAKPMNILLDMRSEQRPLIEKAIRQSGRAEADLAWLPFTSAHTADWVVLLDNQTAIPLTYAHVDGFY